MNSPNCTRSSSGWMLAAVISSRCCQSGRTRSTEDTPGSREPPGGTRRGDIALLSLQAAQKEFEPAGIYVNTASIGLPPRRGIEAFSEAVETWRTGRAEAAGYDEMVNRARRCFAGLVGTAPERVAIGNQVSTF